MKIKLLNLYDAIIADRGIEVQKILHDSFLLSQEIPTRLVTGLLILAVEARCLNAARGIISYNSYSIGKIPAQHYDAIMIMAMKGNFLKQLQISYN